MPKRPYRQHHESPSAGDNKAAIWRARGDALDLNITRLAGRNWAVHYTTPGKNGYTRVVDHRTKKVRRMTRAERRRHGDKWGDEGIRRWRRPNGEAPLTERRAIAYCVKVGALAIRELKSPVMGTHPSAADESLRISKRYGHPGWFKTLYNMSNPRGKCVWYQSRGLQVALIFGKRIAGRARRLAASRRITAKWGTTRPNATW